MTIILGRWAFNTNDNAKGIEILAWDSAYFASLTSAIESAEQSQLGYFAWLLASARFEVLSTTRRLLTCRGLPL